MKVFILNSSSHGLNNILVWLSENTKIEGLSFYRNVNDFLEHIAVEKPDVAFIPLGKSEFSGLKVAKEAKAIEKEVKIVFVSGDRDYALDAYEIGAYGYLLCPIERDKLEKCLMMKKEE